MVHAIRILSFFDLIFVIIYENNYEVMNMLVTKFL
jgi:hypothetical protein